MQNLLFFSLFLFFVLFFYLSGGNIYERNNPNWLTSISRAAFVSMWNAPFRPTEWVLEVGRTKPVNVWRYSDAVVLISQLSKSCSCGIRMDTVPVGDLGGGRGGGERDGRRERGGDEGNNHSHQGLYRFHLP